MAEEEEASFLVDDEEPYEEETPLVAKLRRQLKEQSRELGGYRKKEEQSQQDGVRSALGDMGYAPGVAKLWLQDNAEKELTPEAVAEWAEPLGFSPLPPASDEGDAEQEEVPIRPTFVPTTPMGGEPPTSPLRKTSYEAYRTMVTDPGQHAKALELLKKGLVDF